MLTNQPFDVIEKIVCLIDDFRDRVNLALTNRYFSDLIIPHHLAHREIQCHPRHEWVWKYLIDHPKFASQIGTFELIASEMLQDAVLPAPLMKYGNSVSHIPTAQSIEDDHYAGDTISIDFGYIIQAVLTMKSLRVFRMGHNSLWWSAIPNLFAAMNVSGAQITELDLWLNTLGNIHHKPETINEIWSFSNITHFELVTCPTGILSDDTFEVVNHEAYISDMMSMLMSRCPTLQKLSLSVSCSIPYFLSQAHWPRLSELKIGPAVKLYQDGQPLEERVRVLRGFLERHNSLEDMFFERKDTIHPTVLYPGILPSLRAFAIGRRQSYLLPDMLPLPMAQKLHMIHAPVTHGCESFLSEMKSLRSCVIYVSPQYHLRHFPRLPTLEILIINGLSQTPFQLGDEDINRILLLRELTHLLGLSSAFDVSTPEGLDSLRTLAVLPKLSVVAVRMAGIVTNVTLSRDANGKFTRVAPIDG
ncbi:hypothetical protein BU17DRAFT_96148 [Hysterangium stoloniferum]|nr:hypothetical protein BU17DRAFT_96148 [Hysterangium stoloniferum]